MSAYCWCGHTRNRHRKLDINQFGDDDVKFCFTCECPKYKHFSDKRSPNAETEKMHYPKRGI